VVVMEETPPLEPERREHKRVPYGAWVEDLSQTGSLGFYLARDLSLGGILLQSIAPPTIGCTVRLRLVVENEPEVMTVDGKVVRHAVDEGGRVLFAVQFLELDPPQFDFLNALVIELERAAS
jgi:hypothetical protein